MSKLISRKNIHELVSEEIQKYIIEKELKEGDKLPSVETLTKMFGVSRTSVRESMRYLETVDIIEVINGKGIFVKDTTSFRFSGKVKIENEKKFLLHVLDVRRAIEGKAVELAAKRIDDRTIALMGSCMDHYDILQQQNKDTSEIDYQFHQYIYTAAANPLLKNFYDSISDLIKSFFNEPLGDKQLFDNTYPYHRPIYEAIANHDAEEALKQFNILMDVIEDTIRNYISN